MLNIRPQERPSAATILKNSIINTRIICYLEENKCDDNKAEIEINQFIEKNKNDESIEIRVLEKELKDIITDEKYEKNKKNKKNTKNEENEHNEENEENEENEVNEEENEKNEQREKKAQCDLLIQMTIMKTQYIKNSILSN